MNGTKDIPESVSGQSERRPLQDVRVLDFGHILAGPYCARLLADLGATVVKVESRSRPERMGQVQLGEMHKGRRDRSPQMLMTNRNKLSVTINLKSAPGRVLARRLTAKADILVENFSAGTMERLGLGYPTLQVMNPRLIYIRLSGYGQDGPRREWKSMNMNLQAYSGLMATTGIEGDPPTTTAVSWFDYIGGVHGAIAAINALYERSHSDRGAYLDLSQFECSVSSLGATLIAAAVTGKTPSRLGNRDLAAAPQGCYRCKGIDEWCAVSVRSDDQFESLIEIAGGEVPELASPRFASLAGRLTHYSELDHLIETWTVTRSNVEVESALKRAGMYAERVRKVQDILADPASQPVFRAVEDPIGSGYQQLFTMLPIRFQKTPSETPLPAPHIGSDTSAVLTEWLGLEEEELELLESQGALY